MLCFVEAGLEGQGPAVGGDGGGVLVQEGAGEGKVELRAEVLGVGGNGFLEEVGSLGVFLGLEGFEASAGWILLEQEGGEDQIGQHYPLV